jgi:hypothetical protein
VYLYRSGTDLVKEFDRVTVRGGRAALAAAHLPLDPCGLLADADAGTHGRGRCHPCKPSASQASAFSR